MMPRARSWLVPHNVDVWPAPEVAARLALDTEIPRGAHRIRTIAVARDWRVVATYSRGTRPGRPPRVVDSVALRMWHRTLPRRAVAVWVDGRVDFACVWGRGRPMKRCTIAVLVAELDCPQ